MRGIYSSVTDIRRQVFTEVARMAYEGGDYSRVEELPYKILPGEVSKYRDSIFLERAIVGERLRLSMGLPLRPIDEHAPLSTGIEEAARPEKYYEPPLINIIKFACNACPEKSFHVTDMCQGCLAHPCVEVCPKGAVSIVHGKSVIDQSKCVKCGQCANVCPYGAIHKMERPCAKACGMDAIGSDELGRAKIDLRLRQVRVLRHVPCKLSFRRHRGQKPDLPGHPVHQPGRPCHRRRGSGLCGPVRPGHDA